MLNDSISQTGNMITRETYQDGKLLIDPRTLSSHKPERKLQVGESGYSAK
jgi:hypothetical protein